jgi:cystathionine beta-lyase/cystathionine gamma-synthase
MDDSDRQYDPTTRLIHGRMRSEAWEYGHHLVPPISTSTTFRLDSTSRGAMGFEEFGHSEGPDHHIYIYDRLHEPNKDLLEERLATAEGGEVAVTFASGMAAISAVLGVLTKAGDHVLTHRAMYGCTHSLLHRWYPRMNVAVSDADLRDVEASVREIRPETRVVYLETPANPTMDIIDLGSLAAELHLLNTKRDASERIWLVVDNTFSTPFCQRPIEYGADFVVHSLTKGLSGFGTDMGGVVIGPHSHYTDLLMYRKDFGGVLSSRAAWSVLAYGLPSLAVRVRHAQGTARHIASWLENHPAVSRVAYPGLPSFEGFEVAQRQMRDYDGNFSPGTLIYFELKGATPAERQRAGAGFINHLAENAYTITLAVSLGNVRTLVEHPSTMTHAPIPPEEQLRAGIEPSGIRLAIGLEAVDDLLRDLESAIEAARRVAEPA